MIDIRWCSSARWPYVDALPSALRRLGYQLVVDPSYDEETIANCDEDIVILDFCDWQVARWSAERRKSFIVVRVHGPELEMGSVLKRIDWRNVDLLVGVNPALRKLAPVRFVHIGYAVDMNEHTFIEREFGVPHRLGIFTIDVEREGIDGAFRLWWQFDGPDGGRAGMWNLWVKAFGLWQGQRMRRIQHSCSHHALAHRVRLENLASERRFWEGIEVAWSPGGDGAADVPMLEAMASGCYPLVRNRRGAKETFGKYVYENESDFVDRLAAWGKRPKAEKANESRQIRDWIVARNDADLIAQRFVEAIGG